MRFFDFCSGIGGGRLALEAAGHTCVGYSEKDKTADIIFSYLTGDCRGFGDIMLIDPSRLPDFDIMLAAFPYKNFSAGGKRSGFYDNKAHVITALIGILSAKRPLYFIFENDKGFLSYNGGKAFKTVCGALETAGYEIFSSVLNSSDYGIPYNRERVYIVGSLKGALSGPFEWPQKTECRPVSEFLGDEFAPVLPVSDPTFLSGLQNDFNRGRIFINELLSRDHIVIDRRWNDYRVFEDKVPALSSSRMGIVYTLGGELKKITAYEALLLQGYPEKIAKKARDAGILRGSLMKYAANSVSVNVIEYIARQIEKQAVSSFVPSEDLEMCSGTYEKTISTKKRFVSVLCDYENCEASRKWLSVIGEEPENIDFIKADPIRNDSPITVYIKQKGKRIANISKIGFYSLSGKMRTSIIEKRPLCELSAEWNMPEDVYTLLDLNVNKKVKFKDMAEHERETVRSWFFENRFLVVSDIICGRDGSARDFMFFSHKSDKKTEWIFTGVGSLVGKKTSGDASFVGDALKVCGITLSRTSSGQIKFTVSL
ncbi:MAG: DNA (cytosine-5-)-methyltransferase [Ruminococcaceae bacterium]|nr:DNA (cytosine-5-)-methyltransferase [Oscillospiraceae bacterium]